MISRRASPTVAVAALAAVAALGCTPSIHGFRAEPNVICKGSPTTLTWAASTGGEITATPPDPSLGAVDANGTRAVTPVIATIYRLTVTHLGKSASRDVGVEVLTAPTEAKPIGASVADPSTSCEANTLAVTVTAPAADWDPHIRVASVAVASGVTRSYHVEHGGRQADVSPGSSSAVFAGLPVQGSWRLSTPLAAPEACGRNVPRSLIIDVSSTCGP